MRLLIVGAGSTGGYFGARLDEAGRDVTFLVRPERAVRLRADGLRVISPHGDLSIAPRLVTAGEIDRPFDAILLTVKGFALEGAMADLAPAVGPDTMILPVLNGMRHMEVLSERFGARAVVGCALKVATALDAEGRIVQLAPFQDLAYGELNNSATPRILALDETLRGAGFSARLSADIVLEMWRKWVLLASIGAITCLMRGPVGAVASAPGGRDFALSLIDEVVATVTAEGHPPGDEFVAATKAQLTDPVSGQTSSMFRDLRAGKPIEAEQIVGDLLPRAARAGLRTPLLAAAYAHLCVYQAQAA